VMYLIWPSILGLITCSRAFTLRFVTCCHSGEWAAAWPHERGRARFWCAARPSAEVHVSHGAPTERGGMGRAGRGCASQAHEAWTSACCACRGPCPNGRLGVHHAVL
jgi:hypothetical protein